ncbi:hypothetical protein CYG49_04330, partial [Candidatus Saccharibacteria bacterium]
KLTGGESVHLLDWPKTGAINEAVLDEMAQTRAIIEQGLAKRMSKSDSEQQVKVRQPLNQLGYSGKRLGGELEQIIAEEVNVKHVINNGGDEGDAVVVTLDKDITPELKREGMMREVIRNVQNARKQAGLNVDDRIILSLTTEDGELQQAIAEHEATIASETLATEMAANDGFLADVTVEGAALKLQLQKA